MTEADFLAALRTLPLHPAARGLRDDSARLTRAPLVVTTDTLVEGVHFLASDTPQDVAWKLVATNLSDIAGKGGKPDGILLNYPLTDDAWDRAFLEGLAEVLTACDAQILGGDTVRLPPGAPRVLTVTAFGCDTPAPPRGGAGENDALWVTGTIGDAGAGRARPDRARHLARRLGLLVQKHLQRGIGDEHCKEQREPACLERRKNRAARE